MIEVSVTVNDDATMRLIPKNGDRDRMLLKVALEGRVLHTAKEQEDGSWELKFVDASKMKP